MAWKKKSVSLIGRLDNMHQLIKPLILILFLTASLTSFASGRTVPLEGYNWYNEKSEGKQEKPVDRKESSNKFVQQEPELPEYEKNIRSLQEEHNQAHRKALDNPTIENILAELRLEKEMLRKSQLYGQRRVAIGMLDSQFTDMKAHSNVLHRRVQEEIDEVEVAKNLEKLSQDWGLILQVEGNCRHCHAFAPIVLKLANKYGFQLLAASKDGTDFHGIEGIADNGQMLLFNPNRETPMLYLIKSNGREILPISRGINSEDQIIINIKNIDKHIRRLFL
jgi:conjugal transfer pilus assembly protein TraF